MHLKTIFKKKIVRGREIKIIHVKKNAVTAILKIKNTAISAFSHPHTHSQERFFLKSSMESEKIKWKKKGIM